MEEVLNTFKNIEFTTLLTGIVTLAVCYIISRLILRGVRKLIPKSKTVIPETLHGTIMGIMKVLLYGVSLLITAGTLGISVTSIVALLSVVGIALSLAIQGILNNVAGGIIIVTGRPFSVGDVVSTDSFEGTVTNVSLTHTRLQTLDGRTVVVPNSLMHTSTITNNTVSGARRVDVDFGASYDNSPEQVRAAVMEILTHAQHIAPDPAPVVVVVSYNDNDITYGLRVWTDPAHYYEVRNYVNEAIYDAFRRNGIEMSYPHVNVHMQP